MTATQIQFRRGSAAQMATFTGAPGEVVVDTTNMRTVVHDGSTAGGWPADLAVRTAVADASYAARATDRIIAYTAITAARIVSLPAAASYPVGTLLFVVDESGSASAGNTITASPNGSDTIVGASTAVINSAYGFMALESNGSGKWTIATKSGGVPLAATDGNVITASGGTTYIGGPGGMVNKFRNASMDVAQRGSTGSVAAGATAYTVDGWMLTTVGAASAWQQRGPGNIFGGSYLILSGGSGLTTLTLKQRIESVIAAELLAPAAGAGVSGVPQIVTVQVRIYNGSGATLTPKLATFYPTAQDNFSATTADLAATNLQSIANGACATVAYSFMPSVNIYLGYEVQLQFGNALNGSGNVYVSQADIRVTPGATAGLCSNPPPPELRPIMNELALCQRYFQKSYNQGTAPGTNVGSAGGAATSTASNASGQTFQSVMVKFAVVMRVAPTITTYDNTGASGKISWTNGSTWTNGASITAGPFVFDNGFQFTAGAFTSLYQINCDFAATAEL